MVLSAVTIVLQHAYELKFNSDYDIRPELDALATIDPFQKLNSNQNEEMVYSKW